MSIALGNVWSKSTVWALVALMTALLLGGCSADAGSENVRATEGALCSGVTATLTPAASPVPAGTQVGIVASGSTCGAGETPEYVFFYYNAAGTFFLLRTWGAGTSVTWDTTGLPGGTYGVYVGVRPAGSNGAATDGVYVGHYFIGNVCNTTTSFSASPTSPQPAGTIVSLQATATCTGGASAEFRYGYFTPAGSLIFINTTYTSAAVPWDTTGRAGNVTLLVYARAVGNTSVEESSSYRTFTVGAAASLCSSVTLGASPTSPQSPGTIVHLSASASPCATPEYSFYYRVFGPSAWILIRDFGPSTVNWDTTSLASGTYELLVRARSVGTTGTGDSYNEITYAIGNNCGSVTLGTSPSSPAGQGAQVVLTGAATCTAGATPEYSFYYAPSSGGANTLIRTWGAASATWDTSIVPANTYTLTVYARAVGNSADFEAIAVASFVVAGVQLSSVASGFGYHTCAVVNNATARCWGENPNGELGNGQTAGSSLPVTVTGLSTVSAVVTGLSFSCALLTDHSVRCWGANSFGQLGNGTTNASSTPVTVTGISDATAISAGMNHACALRAGGTVSCWGENAQGQLGDATAASFPKATSPVAVGTLSGASAISCGGFSTCALVGGAVDCWGDNSFGQLGDGNGGANKFSFAPVAVSGISGATSISGGEQSACAVVSGAVKCWGDNTYGQLGNGSTTQANTPVSVSGITTAVQVSAGYPMSCARLSSGAVSCWGYNNEGELGNGGSAQSLTPTAVSGISTASLLSTGGTQSCVMLSGGGAKCWGYNGAGQLGNGTTADAHTPVSVTFP